MLNSFIQLSLIILVVLGISFIIKILKQPLIIGYIISGIAVGPYFFNLLTNNETLTVFSEFGIAFLLFIVGLHLSPKVIKEVGKISLVTGIGQIIFTSLIGYFIGLLLGFSPITALYIAVALTFSSTIIIMKLLSDKEDLEKLYGKISIGFLLVQDLIAILILMIISSFSSDVDGIGVIIATFSKGAGVLIVMIPISIYVLPRLNDFFAKSQEFLFLFSIAWGLGFSALFFYAGFSIEVGALIAGITLSMSPYSYEVSSKLKPLRDFFIISFFLILGSQIIFRNIAGAIFPIILFSLFILIGNPLIVMVLMGIFGYSKRTSFMAGLTVAQISEFSLILIALGVKIGQISSEILSVVTIIGLITIAGSTYMIMYSEKIFLFLSPCLSIFEKKKLKEKDIKKKEYHTFLLGYNRIGFSILKTLLGMRKRYIIVDFNPDVIKALRKKGINCIYGDIEDTELLDELKIDKAKLIISTIPEQEANLMLISKIKIKNPEVIIISTARQISEAIELYKSGADYVILPHFLGGNYVSKLIERAETDKRIYEKEKATQIKELKERLYEGQEHPEIDRR